MDVSLIWYSMGKLGRGMMEQKKFMFREDITHTYTHTTNRKMSKDKRSQLTKGKHRQLTSV